MHILIVLAVIIGLYFLCKYKIVKLFTRIKTNLFGLSTKYLDVNLKPQPRTYSPQIRITEYTKYQVLPKMGVFEETVKDKFHLYLTLLTEKSDPTELVNGEKLADLVWTVIRQYPGKEEYRGVDYIMIKFFGQYKDMDVKLPLVEFLYAIKSGVNSDD